MTAVQGGCNVILGPPSFSDKAIRHAFIRKVSHLSLSAL